MKVYIVMVKDRHTDPEPYPFLTAESAIRFARGYLAPYGDEVGECEVDGWLFYASYSSEGDAIWVVEKEVGP